MDVLLVVASVLLVWIAFAVVAAALVSRTIRRANAEELVVREPALNTAAFAASTVVPVDQHNPANL